MTTREDILSLAVPTGWKLVPVAALKWLNGEGPDDDGIWFGDAERVPGMRGAFWWRTVFNRMLYAAPTPPAAEVPGLIRAAEWHEEQAERLKSFNDPDAPPHGTYARRLRALAAEAPGQEPVAVKGVDSQVMVAATQLDDDQKRNPQWLWYGDEARDVSLGRWQRYPSQAPYVRADLVSAPPTYADAEAKGVGGAAEKLGRFGWHPDPVIDFEIEIEKLESRWFGAVHGLAKPGEAPELKESVAGAVARAMGFQVGGREDGVIAKNRLRTLDAAIRSLASPAPKGEM